MLFSMNYFYRPALQGQDENAGNGCKKDTEKACKSEAILED